MTEPPDTSSDQISPHLEERVRNFFRKGRNSLTVAEQVDLTVPDPPTDRVCVESQTAAEFFLKSFLLANKHKYKKYGHEIEKVLDKCIAIDPSFDEVRESCKHLQDYRGLIEYELGPEGFPSVETAEQCVQYAIQVKEFVEKKLGELGF